MYLRHAVQFLFTSVLIWSVICLLSSIWGRQTFAKSVHPGTDCVNDYWEGEAGKGESHTAWCFQTEEISWETAATCRQGNMQTPIDEKLFRRFHCYSKKSFILASQTSLFVWLIAPCYSVECARISSVFYANCPSVLWHCWLGDTKGILPVKKTGCWFVGGDDLTGTLQLQ